MEREMRRDSDDFVDVAFDPVTLDPFCRSVASREEEEEQQQRAAAAAAAAGDCEENDGGQNVQRLAEAALAALEVRKANFQTRALDASAGVLLSQEELEAIAREAQKLEDAKTGLSERRRELEPAVRRANERVQRLALEIEQEQRAQAEEDAAAAAAAAPAAAADDFEATLAQLFADQHRALDRLFSNALPVRDVLDETQEAALRATFTALREVPLQQLICLAKALLEDEGHCEESCSCDDSGGPAAAGTSAPSAPSAGATGSSTWREQLEAVLRDKVEAIGAAAEAAADDALGICPISQSPIVNPALVGQWLYEHKVIVGYIEAQERKGVPAKDPIDSTRTITRADVVTGARLQELLAGYREETTNAVGLRVALLLREGEADLRRFVHTLLAACDRHMYSRAERLLAAFHAKKRHEAQAQAQAAPRISARLQDGRGGDSAADGSGCGAPKIIMMILQTRERDRVSNELCTVENELHQVQMRAAHLSSVLEKHGELERLRSVTANRWGEEQRETAVLLEAVIERHRLEREAAVAAAKAKTAEDEQQQQQQRQQSPDCLAKGGAGPSSPSSARSESGVDPRGFTFYQHDSCAPACTLCRTPFTLLNRRHHCRLCGFVYCHMCCSRRVFRKTVRTDHGPVRCCERCLVEQHENDATQRVIADAELSLWQYLALNAVPSAALGAERLATNFVIPGAVWAGQALWQALRRAASYTAASAEAGSSGAALPHPHTRAPVAARISDDWIDLGSGGGKSGGGGGVRRE